MCILQSPLLRSYLKFKIDSLCRNVKTFLNGQNSNLYEWEEQYLLSPFALLLCVGTSSTIASMAFKWNKSQLAGIFVHNSDIRAFKYFRENVTKNLRKPFWCYRNREIHVSCHVMETIARSRKKRYDDSCHGYFCPGINRSRRTPYTVRPCQIGILLSVNSSFINLGTYSQKHTNRKRKHNYFTTKTMHIYV